MIAALPMYDRPELRAETDALWAAIRDALRRRGIDAPEALTRDRDPWAVWTDPGLVFAQTCGLPFRARLHGTVSLVATPDFALPGCPAGHYNSVVLARDGRLPPRPRLAVNDPLSQSGWAALHAWMGGRGIAPGPVTLTGSHAASARAVATGAADLAAIDAQTWRLLLRFDGADAGLEIDRTAPTPALPYVTAATRDPGPIRAALAEALAALPPATLSALGLRGVVEIGADAYRAVPIPPNP
ncbi:phosphate/phosphite/phosphonate ABC transporter substrate-binding protein [Roseicyclus persicicus]|uniref:PhnD/SsuA/transferrin family substrate-binding protein n=1 Tax=Roseicyclus persicicus TaxID=2650661 RepID=A0A7X6GXP1_9RHOB|nr:PhnD/SsuA/transferrin family substrate-binding protein [Roseibacterium persicicum]NKX44316.1 PhnD/SsuA/transferrin family substrate-binding protein [Roseibacterium persicicum]